MKNIEDYRHVSFFDIAVSDNDGWFCDIYLNAIFHIDLKTHEIRLEKIIPVKDSRLNNQYANIVYYSEKLYISPRTARDILIYDIHSKELDRIQLDTKLIGADANNLFSSSFLYKNYVYFIPGRYPAIVRLNTENMQMEYITGWYKEIKPYLDGSNRVIFNKGYQIEDNKLYLPFWQGNVIYRMDLDSLTGKVIRLNCSGIQCAAVNADKEDMFITTNDKCRIIRYNNDRYHIYDNMPDEFSAGSGFSLSIPYLNYLIMFPIFGNMILKFDKRTGDIKKYMGIITDYADCVKKQFPQNVYLCMKKISMTKVLLYCVHSGNIEIIDLEHDTGTVFPTVIGNAADIQMLIRYDLSLIRIIRDDEYDIDVFINSLDGVDEKIRHVSYGKLIFRELLCQDNKR